jgi:Predicted metal-dependent hydrolase of the TIM-barrel fold
VSWSNVFLTTSGNFRTPTLVDAIAEVGADRVLFSVDYPFEETADAVEGFDSASLAEPDRLCALAAKTPRDSQAEPLKLLF